MHNTMLRKNMDTNLHPLTYLGPCCQHTDPSYNNVIEVEDEEEIGKKSLLQKGGINTTMIGLVGSSIVRSLTLPVHTSFIIDITCPDKPF
jgi:hypothetical protein